MTRRVVYFTNGFLPDREGVSKELHALYSHFDKKFHGQIYLHNLADRWQFSLRRRSASYPSIFLPIGYPLIKYFEKTADIVHIYGSLTGRLYFKVIKKRPSIITSASALIKARLEECAPSWESIDIIVLESEQDRQTLLKMGVDSKKIYLIYPGVKISEIDPPQMDGPFIILFASAPIEKDPNSLYRRGIGSLIKAAKKLRNCRFIFLWRGKHTKLLQQMIAKEGANNINIIDRIVPNIAGVLESAHCTILSPENREDCKPCPNSLIESLACGRPILASKAVGISNIIEQERCGVAFPPDPEGIKYGIQELRSNYETYKRNALPTAHKYFSIEQFIESYEYLYQKLGIV